MAIDKNFMVRSRSIKTFHYIMGSKLRERSAYGDGDVANKVTAIISI